MRWLWLFGLAALVAVGLWVFLPGDREVGAAVGVTEPAEQDVQHETVPVEPAVVVQTQLSGGTPPVQIAGLPREDVLIVKATFEAVNDAGRIPGTRITLRSDAGVERTELADMSGWAHFYVAPGLWRATCTNDCRPRWLTIAPTPATYTLEVHHWLTIAGEVVDPTGRSVSGASIEQEFGSYEEAARRGLEEHLSWGRWGGATTYWVGRTVTDTRGEFSFVTEENQNVLVARHGDDRSAQVVVSPPQSGLRFVVFAYATATFSFKRADRRAAASMATTVAGMHFHSSVDHQRRVELPVGNHQAVFLQQNGEHLSSAKAAFTVTPDGPNRFEVAFSPFHGLQVTVVDSNGTSLPGVAVAVSARPVDTDMFPEAVWRREHGDAGVEVAPPAPTPDAVAFTAADGTAELVPPRAGAESLYEIELQGQWALAERRMIRLGDDPVTLVAVPR